MNTDGIHGPIAGPAPGWKHVHSVARRESPSGTAETNPTRRDRHLRLIAERGRMGRQTAAGYSRRALAEATIGRFKRVIGEAPRSCTDRRQAAEVAIAADVLNRMIELGRPASVRIA